MSPSGGPQIPQQDRIVEPATCLGCGCACDDIRVRANGQRILETTNACALGATWFGDGTIATTIRVGSRNAALDEALTAIAALLTSAREPLVYLAPEISCEAQREATALADRMRAVLDTISSATVLPSILAAQERGRTTATLGEIRQRADAIVFWGVDPATRYPRFWSRYAPDTTGLHVEGRRGRHVVAVDIGTARGPEDADTRLAIGAAEEVAFLTMLAGALRAPRTTIGESPGDLAGPLAARLAAAHYVALIADGEPPAASEVDRAGQRDPQRAAAMIALAQALNGPTRCALITLRGGGNRSGAEAVLTAETGFPTGVVFARGYPVYRPHDAGRTTDALLVVGDAAQMPPDVVNRFAADARAIVGPRASLHDAAVAVDTGVAGVHVNGTALRMDDVPLRLRPPVSVGLDPAEVLRALRSRVAR
jgi:formylmethanofuran dehydrogenase subunit B